MGFLAPWRGDFGAMKELLSGGWRSNRGQRAEAITGFLRPPAAVNNKPAKTNYRNVALVFLKNTSTFRSQLHISAPSSKSVASSKQSFFDSNDWLLTIKPY